MQMSLDGFIEGPKREFDWPVVREELFKYVNDELPGMGVFLYGRKVYEMMVNFWATADANPSSSADHVAFARVWKAMPKMVFSKTLERAGWNTAVVRETIAEEVAKLKRQPGNDLVLFGGADIASTFAGLGPIDEYRLFVHPVVLGGGKPLFGRSDDRLSLRFFDARTFDPGVVLLRYPQADGASR
jgi:dihydrofolate reductase